MSSGNPQPGGASAATAARRWALRERLRPREHDDPGRGDLRRVENTLLLLAFAVLAVATIADLVRQVHINQRLTADVRTWRTVTGHRYHNISLEQDLKGFSTREIACGNTSPGPPGSRPQVCLIVTGPVRRGLRSVRGGFYLPAYRPDMRENRYGCFGTGATLHMCALATPPGAPHGPLLRSK
jgi:hypothetical protein